LGVSRNNSVLFCALKDSLGLALSRSGTHAVLRLPCQELTCLYCNRGPPVWELIGCLFWITSWGCCGIIGLESVTIYFTAMTIIGGKISDGRTFALTGCSPAVHYCGWLKQFIIFGFSFGFTRCIENCLSFLQPNKDGAGADLLVFGQRIGHWASGPKPQTRSITHCLFS
jgi:hypothetical protein